MKSIRSPSQAVPKSFGNRSKSRDFSTADAGVYTFFVSTGVCTSVVFGGRTAVGQATFLCLSLATAVVFFAVASWRGTRVRPSWVDIPIVLGLLLIAFQLVPLPQDQLERVSPVLGILFPARDNTSGAASLPSWSTPSLAPRETFCQLGLVIGGWLLTIVARHRFRSRLQITRLLDVFASLTAVLAGFAVVQYLFSNEKFFWFYSHPYAKTVNAANGPFTNPNHLGQLVALAVSWPVWCLLSHDNGNRNGDRIFGQKGAIVGAIACLMVMVPAVLLSFSRNALLSCGLCVGLTAAAAYGCAQPEHRSAIRWRVGVAGIAIALIAVLSLTAFGESVEAQIDRNVAELTSFDAEQLDANGARRTLAATVIRGASDFPLFGVGLGAHSSTYHRYWEGAQPRVTFTHAENGPLQLLFETGVTGLALLACVVLIVLYRVGRHLIFSEEAPDRKPIAAIALVVLAVSCFQSLADFSWYVPAIACTVAVIVSVAVGATGPQLSRYGPRIIPIGGLVLSVGALMLFAPSAIRSAQAETHWFSYLRTRSNDDSVPAKLLAAQDLIRTLRCDPEHPEANEAMARMYVWMFNLGQERNGRFELAELRDAVRGGGWDSQELYESWLRDDSVAGEMLDLLRLARRHAIAANNLRPLDVETIILLLNTNFVETYSETADRPYYEQLKLVAPESPLALLERADGKFRKGEIDEALALMAHAYRNGPSLRGNLLKDLAGRVNANGLIELLEMSAGELKAAARAYRELGSDDEFKELMLAAAIRFEDQASTETSLTLKSRWLEQSVAAYRELGDLVAAVRLAGRRVDIEPSDAKARSTLADILVKLERWPEAIRHYEQCAASSGEPNRWDGKLAHCRKMLAEHEAVMMHASGASPAVR